VQDVDSEVGNVTHALHLHLINGGNSSLKLYISFRQLKTLVSRICGGNEPRTVNEIFHCLIARTFNRQAKTKHQNSEPLSPSLVLQIRVKAIDSCVSVLGLAGDGH
jgi:hypothetical protein